VTPNVSVTDPGASDRTDAAPAIGAMTPGQAGSGATRGAAQPTAGDGAASAASAVR
jgi:hypothetical protein